MAKPETSWSNHLESVVEYTLRSQGPTAAKSRFLGNVAERLREEGVEAPRVVSTPYINTIPPEKQAPFPAIGRWNGASRATSAGTPWRWS